MGKTKIEWTDLTWNPLRGCSPVSAGCANCYAAREATRKSGAGGSYEGLAQGGKWTGKVNVIEKTMRLPYTWRDPKMVFVCSMSDLFHDQVDDETIHRILTVIRDNPKHQFQILTKRSKRLASKDWDFPPNAWVGVSIEDQRVVDRLHDLKKVTAPIRWISFEPLIGPVEVDLAGVDWVVVGGESGPGWRPIEQDWIVAIRDECRRTGTAFNFKQWAALHPKKLGRKLSGEIYDEFPDGKGRPVTNETTRKKKTPSVFDNSHDLQSEIARSNSPTLRPPEKGKSETVSDCDVDALLAEPMPDADTDRIQLVAFIKRQYKAYVRIDRKSALFQYRMGQILCRLREQFEYGEWLPFLDATFAFTARTATAWMRLAESATLDEATLTTATELMQRHGIITYRKEKPPTDGEDNAGDNGTDDGEGKPDDPTDRKPLGNFVKQCGDSARALLKKVESQSDESYDDDETDAARLRSHASMIEAAINNMHKSAVRLLELAKQSSEESLADVIDDLTRIVSSAPQFVLRLACADCGCQDEFRATDESGVFSGFETRHVHDWIVHDPITLCPDCLIARHDRSIDEEAA